MAAEEPAAEEGASVQIEAPVEQDTYQTEAAIILSPRRPLKPAPVADLVETAASASCRASAPATRSPPMSMPAPRPGRAPFGTAEDRHSAWRHGPQPKLTQQAIKDLPGDVTFAFAPYGENLQAQVNKARADGHEIMLQLPMEPVGYPANNPGPKTLLTTAATMKISTRCTGI